MLHLLANEVMLKARDIVGEDILDDPEMVNHAFTWHQFLITMYILTKSENGLH
jgi:hypothetical protein